MAAHAYALLGRAARADRPPRRAARPGASRRARRPGGTRRRGLRDAAGRGRARPRGAGRPGRPAAGGSQRPRARARAFARGAAAVPADAARQLHPRAAGRRRRRRRGGGAGARAPVGRRRDADRDQLGPLALPALRAGASRRPRHRAAHPGARCRPRAARGLRCGGDQRRAAGGAPPRSRAAPAGPVQLRRHRGRPRPCRRLWRDRIRGGARSESASGALVAPARRRPHPVRPVPARLPAARGPARHVLRAPARRRRDGAHDLRAQLGLLHRPDREEAAQPLLPRQQRASASAPPAATWPASSARTGTSRRAARWIA